MPFLVIGLGAFLGANSRYLVGGWSADRFGAAFPYGTLLINVTGSFVSGLFLTLIAERFVVHPNVRLFFVVGFIGAYTTFSTYMFESLALLQTCLFDCGLVSRSQQGRHVYYQLSDERVAELLGRADELLADVARGVYECTRYGRHGGR